MWKKLLRLLKPNPFEKMLRKAQNRGAKKILLAWNRGLGDIALGLFAMITKIREMIPDAEITFILRKDLAEGFRLIKNINTLIAPDWNRNKPYDVQKTLHNMNIDPENFDLIIEWPDPTQWVRWQLGTLTPKLEWDSSFNELYQKFSLPKGYFYIGIQPLTETPYGFWRNWSSQNWSQVFSLCEKNPSIRFLLFGKNADITFPNKNIFDLRGKTSLFEILSLAKNVCSLMILPDSGILSMCYYLNIPFPIEIISLWEKVNHGILKQNVASPNPLLTHTLCKNISEMTSEQMTKLIFQKAKEIPCKTIF